MSTCSYLEIVNFRKTLTGPTYNSMSPPDLLEFVDAGAAALVAAAAGDGAVEERHQAHHQAQQGRGHVLRQGHRHQRALYLVMEPGVILSVQQLSLPKIERLLNSDY